MKFFKQHKGAVALINLLIISAVLMFLVVVASDLSVTGSYQYLNYYSEQDLSHSAEACLEETIVRLERDTSIIDLSLVVGDTNCTVAITGDITKSVTINVSRDNLSQDFSAVLSLVTQGQANNISLVTWQKI